MLIKPYKKQFQNRLETFNELTILSVVSSMMVFTGASQDVNLKVFFGWLVIGIIVFNILVNLFFVLIEAIKNFKKFILKMKNCCKKKEEVKVVDTEELKFKSYNFLAFPE